MQRFDQKGYFPSKCYVNEINKAKKFKSDTSEIVKSLKILLRKGYDFAIMNL